MSRLLGSRRARGRLLAAGLIAFLSIGFAAPANAQDDFDFYPPPAADCIVPAGTTWQPGQVFIAFGGPGCFDPDTFIQMFFGQSPDTLIATIRVRDDGSYSTQDERPIIPRTARSGSATITVTGTRALVEVTETQAITIAGAVIPAPGLPRGPGLPDTGAAVAGLAVWGFGFLASGVILVMAARRRREAVLAGGDASYPLVDWVDPTEIRVMDAVPDAYDRLRDAFRGRRNGTDGAEAPDFSGANALTFATRVWGTAPALPAAPVPSNGSVSNGSVSNGSVSNGSAAAGVSAAAVSSAADPDAALRGLKAEIAAWTS